MKAYTTLAAGDRAPTMGSVGLHVGNAGAQRGHGLAGREVPADTAEVVEPLPKPNGVYRQIGERLATKVRQPTEPRGAM